MPVPLCSCKFGNDISQTLRDGVRFHFLGNDFSNLALLLGETLLKLLFGGVIANEGGELVVRDILALEAEVYVESVLNPLPPILRLP